MTVRETHVSQYSEVDLKDPEVRDIVAILRSSKGVLWTDRSGVITFYYRDPGEASPSS